MREAFARLLALSEPVLLGAFRRWIEHEIAQAIAIEAEVASGGASLPGAVTVAFLFGDLTGFTAFADAEGDAAAAEVADSFARIVAEQRGEFLLMKSLGDGAMLVYPEGIAAVSAAARIIEQTRQLRSPLPVHAGAHVGAAIARDGDYDGSSVNLAARLLGVAQPDQLIATREVVDRTADSYNWEPLGSRESRGIGQPVDVFCLSSRGTHPRTSTAVRSPRRWRAENLEIARGEQRLARLAEDERPCATGSTEHRR